MCYHCGQREHLSKDCWAWKYGHHKKFEKAESVIDGDKNDVVLCLLTSLSKKECKNKEVWSMEDVKQPLEAGVMCTIDGDIFFCS